MPTSPTRRRALRASLTLSALLALGVATAAPASAHDRLVSSAPADGETVTVAPAQLTLTMSADPIDLGSQIVVTDAAGADHVTGLTVQGRDVVAAFDGALAGGPYTVQWRVVSGDGHPIEGTFAFTVDGPTAAPTTAEPSTEPASTEPTNAAASTDMAPTSAAPTASASEGGSSLPRMFAFVFGGAAVAVVVALVVARARARGER